MPGPAPDDVRWVSAARRWVRMPIAKPDQRGTAARTTAGWPRPAVTPADEAGGRPAAPGRGRGPPAAGGRRRRSRAGAQPLAAYLLLSPALVLYIAFIGIPLIGIVVISFVQWDLISPPHFVGPEQLPDGRARPAARPDAVEHLPVRHHDHRHPPRARPGPGAGGDHGPVPGGPVLGADRHRHPVPDVGRRRRADVVLHHGRRHRAAELLPAQDRHAARRTGWPRAPGRCPALVIIDVWATIGFTFIIFLVGLQTIPSELYEAASIDGAGAVRPVPADHPAAAVARPRSSRRRPRSSARSRSSPGRSSTPTAGPASPPRRSCSTSTARRSRTTSSATAPWCR